jgi:hypothetical protein
MFSNIILMMNFVDDRMTIPQLNGESPAGHYRYREIDGQGARSIISPTRFRGNRRVPSTHQLRLIKAINCGEKFVL